MRTDNKPHTQLTASQRWDLYCAIVERYTREYKVLPAPGVVYFDIHIGNWLASQRELSSLGLLPSAHQNRINNLDILVAELNPTSLSDLLEPLRRAAPKGRDVRPVPRKKERVRVPPLRVVETQTVTPRAPEAPPTTEEVKVSDNREDGAVKTAPEAEVEAAVDDVEAVSETADIASEVEAEAADTHEDTAVAEAAPDAVEVEAVSETDAAAEVEDTAADVESVPATEVEDVSESEGESTNDSELAQRVAGVTDFYTTHRRLPKRKEASIRAGGASITWWTWGLVPAYVEGKLSAEELDTLAVEPWWHLILERANKLKTKRAAETVTEDVVPEPVGVATSTESNDTAEETVSVVTESADLVEPETDAVAAEDEETVSVVTESAEPVDPVEVETSTESDDTEPAVVDAPKAPLPKVRDADAAARRKSTVPHRRNSLAAESRREKEEAASAAAAKVLMTDLPETGLVRLLTFDADGDYVRAVRVVAEVNVARSLRNLTLSNIPYHAHRTGATYRLTVVLYVSNIYDTIPAVEKLGYTVTDVSSTPLEASAK